MLKLMCKSWLFAWPSISLLLLYALEIFIHLSLQVTASYQLIFWSFLCLLLRVVQFLCRLQLVWMEFLHSFTLNPLLLPTLGFFVSCFLLTFAFFVFCFLPLSSSSPVSLFHDMFCVIFTFKISYFS